MSKSRDGNEEFWDGEDLGGVLLERSVWRGSFCVGSWWDSRMRFKKEKGVKGGDLSYLIILTCRLIVNNSCKTSCMEI